MSDMTKLSIPDIPFSIIAETPSYLVVAKPAGMPAVPLKTGGKGETLLDAVADLYPDVRSVQGRNEWEGGVVHRLDTLTSGLTVIARTDEAWWALQAQQTAGLFAKTYAAWSFGRQDDEMFPPGFPSEIVYYVTKDGLFLRSSFRPWGVGARAVRPVCEDATGHGASKATDTIYETTIVSHEKGPGKLNTFHVQIYRGFRHQIRCHLAWYGFPLVGDSLYGGEPNDRLGLFAEKVEFEDPYAHERVVYTLGSMFFT